MYNQPSRYTVTVKGECMASSGSYYLGIVLLILGIILLIIALAYSRNWFGNNVGGCNNGCGSLGAFNTTPLVVTGNNGFVGAGPGPVNTGWEWALVIIGILFFIIGIALLYSGSSTEEKVEKKMEEKPKPPDVNVTVAPAVPAERTYTVVMTERQKEEYDRQQFQARLNDAAANPPRSHIVTADYVASVPHQQLVQPVVAPPPAQPVIIQQPPPQQVIHHVTTQPVYQQPIVQPVYQPPPIGGGQVVVDGGGVVYQY